jgi:Flp pilus assembly pilin Flp
MKQELSKNFPRIFAEEGIGVVEYGLLIAGIALALLLVTNILGQQVTSLANLIQSQ